MITFTFKKNYVPPGNEYALKLATNEKSYELKDWLKFLIDPESYQEYNSQFNKSYRENIVVNIDAKVFSHQSYKNLNWGDAKNINFVDGYNVIKTESLPFTKVEL